MSEMKRCVQCGMLKDASEFRRYTYSTHKGTEGRYRTCKRCEAINASYNRLKKKLEGFRDADGVMSVSIRTSNDFAETMEAVNKIEQLYARLERQGLRVPSFGSKPASTQPAVLSEVDRLLHFYDMAVPNKPEYTRVEVELETPEDLKRWLEADMDEWRRNELSPEYLQETIYESLKAKYRPQTGVDKNTYLPIYDDTWKDVLNQILRRFDEYEEMMAESEESEDARE